MARAHGRILSSIWEDEDFLALTEQQQRLYLFLISQPNLNHAGLLPLTLRRWARKSRGLTAAELDKHLQALTETGFIVLDDDTEELLIRSFVRNDGVWKQPKVMGAMVSGALEISSRMLRRALLAEMDRIPLDDLSDDPTRTARGDGPSIRQQVADHIEVLRRAFGEPDPTPSGRASAPPSATPSRTPSDTPTEGGRKASTRAHVGAHVRAAPALSPTPTPAPTPSLSRAAAATSSAATATTNERETPSHPNTTTDDATRTASVAQQTVHIAKVVPTDDEPAFIAWITANHAPRSSAWWRTVAANGDLPALADTWRTQTTPAAAIAAALPPWCGDCGDRMPLARNTAHLRQIEDDRGNRRPCPNCHPNAHRKAS